MTVNTRIQQRQNKAKKYSIFGFIKYAKGFTLSTVMSPVFMILEVVLEVLIPLIMANTINYVKDAITAGNAVQSEVMAYIARQGLIMIVMSFGSLTGGMMSAICASKAGAGFSKNLRKSLFGTIQGFSFSNIDTFSTASLVTRCTTDVVNVQNCFIQLIRTMVRSPLMFVMATVMAFSLNARLSMIFVVAIPVIGISAFFIMRRAFPRFGAMLKGYDDLNKEVQENLINIRVVKSFVREDYERAEFTKKANNLMKLSISAEKAMVFLMPLMQLVMYASKLSITGIGGNAVIDGGIEDFDVGDLSAMITYAVQILNSLLMLTMIAVTYVTSKASINRIGEVLDTKTDMIDGNSNNSVQNGSISFENVNFSYNSDKGNPVLRNINLTINSGETVGIIGGTGEGKSILVQLIPRLYDCDEGSVKVGGIDVKDYTQHNLREGIGMVLQKNLLFSGTIKDNLKWGNEDATQEQIEQACMRAQAHDFITSFPNSYDTVLGQGGVNVSGGQKQRLCIARALLKEPKILIFDDSTSAVDTNTDERIRVALADGLKDTTKIIIAQRITSVENADKIIVLNNGEIADVGGHKELLSRCNIYQEVYALQTKEGV